MTKTPLACYILGTMALGLAGNVLDPDMTGPWMRGSFLLLAIGFVGELAITGLGANSGKSPS